MAELASIAIPLAIGFDIADQQLPREEFITMINAPWIRFLFEHFTVMIIIPLAIGIGVGFCYVAARHDVAVIWPTTGLLLIAFFGSSLNTHFYFPTTVDETATIGGGIGIYPAMLFQGALASFGLLGTYFWWRHRRQRTTDEASSFGRDSDQAAS